MDSLILPAWIPKKKEWFALDYKGYLKIEKEGLYTFSVNADDGAILYIDDVLVVDNDGYHYSREKSGNIGLGEGYHSIRLAYFEGKYTPVLEVKIMCQGLKKQAIPLSMLWHE
jgi:hexosaminidase